MDFWSVYYFYHIDYKPIREILKKRRGDLSHVLIFASSIKNVKEINKTINNKNSHEILLIKRQFKAIAINTIDVIIGIKKLSFSNFIRTA